MRRTGVGIVVAGAVTLAVPAAAQEREAILPPMTEQEAAAVLADGRLTPERDRALALALNLGSRAGPELRGAVIDAAWAEWRGETDRPEDSEEKLSYLYAVVDGRDSRGIPLLLDVPVGGSAIPNALADFGPARAFGRVLEAAAHPGGHDDRVTNGLVALRFMVEDGSLGPAQVARIRGVVRERFSEAQHSPVVYAAIRLAVALDDPELRGIVETLATDRAAAEALVSPHVSDGATWGHHYAGTVDEVQQRARLFLSGGGADIGPVRSPPPRD